MIPRLLVTTLFLSCIPAMAGADSLMAFRTSDHRSDPPRPGSIEISTRDGSSRMEFSESGDGESSGVIFRGDSREMIVLDHEARQYVVMDEEMMQRMASQVGDAMRQMREALAGMPEEQRAMAEQMMKQHLPEGAGMEPPEETTLHETGNRGSVNGYDCRYFEMRRDDRKVSEICVTPWSSIEGGEEASGALQNMAGFFEKMASSFAEAGGMDIMGEQRDFFRHLQELDGYPVLARDYDETGVLLSETRLESAVRTQLEAGLFEPPADYRETSPGM